MKRKSNGRFAKKIPFWHLQSIKMWLSIAGAFFVAWNGYTTFRHDRRIDKNEEFIQSRNIAFIPTLIYWDSLLFIFRYKDSIRETQMIDDIFDSLYDHRFDLQLLEKRSHIEPVFRGR